MKDDICKIAMGRRRGNEVQAAHEIADRTDGKPRRAIELDNKMSAAQMLAAFLGVSVEKLPPPEQLE